MKIIIHFRESLKAEQLDLFGGAPTPVGPKPKKGASAPGVPRAGLHAEKVHVGGAHPHEQTVWKAEAKQATATNTASRGESAAAGASIPSHLNYATLAAAASHRSVPRTAPEPDPGGHIKAADEHGQRAAEHRMLAQHHNLGVEARGLHQIAARHHDAAQAERTRLAGMGGDADSTGEGISRLAHEHGAEAHRFVNEQGKRDAEREQAAAAWEAHRTQHRHHRDESIKHGQEAHGWRANGHHALADAHEAARAAHDAIARAHKAKDSAAVSAGQANLKAALDGVAGATAAVFNPAPPSDPFDHSIEDKRHPLHSVMMAGLKHHNTASNQHGKMQYSYDEPTARKLHKDASYAHMDAAAAYTELQHATRETAPSLLSAAQEASDRAKAATAATRAHALRGT